VWPYSPDSPPYPGPHQKIYGKWVKRGDPAPLLFTGEASPGVLCPDVESSVQDRCGPVGAFPEQSHKNNSRNETPLL